MAQAKAAPAKKASPKVAPKETKPKGQVQAPKISRKKPIAQGVGRRKASVARVWVRPGTGNLIINEKDYKNYFDTEITQLSAMTPFRLVSATSGYDVTVNVEGGGKWGQADAVKLGISRALVTLDEALRPLLRENGLLTVDSRVKERKKYGQRGARRKFQFVKR